MLCGRWRRESFSSFIDLFVLTAFCCLTFCLAVELDETAKLFSLDDDDDELNSESGSRLSSFYFILSFFYFIPPSSFCAFLFSRQAYMGSVALVCGPFNIRIYTYENRRPMLYITMCACACVYFVKHISI